MLDTRLPVEVLTGGLAVWPAYRRGLLEVYAGIGAADLAAGPDLPPGVATVVVARTADEEIVGGVVLRENAEIAQHPGLENIATVIAEREPNEIGGCWLRPAWRGTGIATGLVREAVKAAGEQGRRWTVTLANQFSLRAAVRAGFVPDARFRDLPFPDSRFRSTLCWFDHQGEA